MALKLYPLPGADFDMAPGVDAVQRKVGVALATRVFRFDTEPRAT